jgi:hypothetical protein
VAAKSTPTGKAKSQKFGGKQAPPFGKGAKEQTKNKSGSEKEPTSKQKDKR